MFKKKITSVFIVSAIITSMITGCGEDSVAVKSTGTGFEPKLNTDTEVSLDIIGTYGNFEALEQVILDFADYYPNVNISYEYVDNMEQALPARCESGDKIDIVYYGDPNLCGCREKMFEDYFVDLGSEEFDFSGIDDRALKMSQINGKQYMLPVYYYLPGLLVNTTILKENGIEVPKNRSEFENACDKLHEKGITPIYCNSQMMGQLFYNHIMFDEQLNDPKGTALNSLNNAKSFAGIYDNSLECLKNWDDRGYIDYSGDRLENYYNALILRFLEGDIPFLVGNSDTISGVRKREKKSETYMAKPFDYIFTPAPLGDDGFECAYNTALSFAVYKKSKNADYALEFARFMSTKEELAVMAKIKGMPSVAGNKGDNRFDYFDNLSDGQKRTPQETGLSASANYCIYSTCKNLVYAVNRNNDFLDELFEQYMLEETL